MKIKLDNKIILCLCEGEAERAIIDLLLDNDKLIFTKEDLIDKTLHKCRSSKRAEKRFFDGIKYPKDVVIVRFEDSLTKFKLSKTVSKKVEVLDVITKPEIEIILIYFNDWQREYNKFKNEKPSIFVKKKLKQKNVKSYNFVYAHLNKDVNRLVAVIKKIKGPKNQMSIKDLLSTH